jgi:hypothetical protein
MALDNPGLYLPCWRPIDVTTVDDKRQHVYEDLAMSYWWLSYKITGFPEPELRAALASLFKGEAPRRYWSTVRNGWFPTYAGNWSGRQGRRFTQIVNEEYEKAVAAGPPTTPRRFGDPQKPTDDSGAQRRGDLVAPLLGVLAGVALGAILRPRQR